jgi:hypothetical protein
MWLPVIVRAIKMSRGQASPIAPDKPNSRYQFEASKWTPCRPSPRQPTSPCRPRTPKPPPRSPARRRRQPRARPTGSGLTSIGNNLYELVKGQGIVVYPDDSMRVALNRAIAIETPRGFRIAKEKTSHKIDVVVALAMAALAAVEQGQRAPVEAMPIVFGGGDVFAHLRIPMPAGAIEAGGAWDRLMCEESEIARASGVVMGEVLIFKTVAARSAERAAVASIAQVERYAAAGLMAPEFAQEVADLMRSRLARLAAGGHP